MSNKPHDIVRGSLLALLAFFCMAIFGILTKVALEEGSFIWVSFIAYLVGSSALLPYVITQGKDFLKSSRLPMLISRAVIGTLASFLYTISIRYIPIVNGTLLFNTAPLFIPLIVFFFLKGKISRSVWIAVVIGFLGIVMIIKPTAAIFTQPGNLIGLASGVSLAIAYLLTKLLTDTDPRIRIIFYYLGIGTLIQIPLLFFSDLPSSESCFYAALSGLALVIAQIFLVTAYKYAEASEVGVYQYASVVFVGFFGWWLWDTVPSLWDLFGIILVTVAGIVVIRSNNKTPLKA